MNIAEILKDCPCGTSLYSPIYGELSLISVNCAYDYPICCRVLKSGNAAGYTEDGKNNTTDAEPTLFPSKDQRDWSKFEVPGQKPKYQFKPFDKVLVRDCDTETWGCNLFGYIDKDGDYMCVNGPWSQCIPYEGNEHLLGTTNIKQKINNDTNKI